METRTEQLVDEVAGWLRDARAVTVLTGAGISTDSGIPDFRGPNGLWTRNPDHEKLVTIGCYLADPEIRRRSWLMRREMFRLVIVNAEPTPYDDVAAEVVREPISEALPRLLRALVAA